MSATSSVSILIPTHNRRDVLSQTLDSLAQMDRPSDIRVELIVVPNACSDGTEAMLAERGPALPFPVRVIPDTVPNLNRARNAAAQAATGDILALLDDDVWVEKPWLGALVRTYREHPADIVGGKCTLWWSAVQEPEWISREVASLLTSVDHGANVIELFSPYAVAGANLSFRRSVYDKVGPFITGLDRTAGVLLAHGESSFLLAALGAGMRMFYSPDAAVRHWVAPHRLENKYLCDVSYGNGRSSIFIKKDFGAGKVARAVAGHAYLALWHGALESAASLRGDKKSMMIHRTRRMIGLGGLKGVAERLGGKSPVGKV